MLKFEELESGGVYARIPGELSEMDPEAWDRLCELARRKDKLALDLAACDRVDSTSIARLLRLRKIAVVERGHELVLGHLSADLQGTLLVTGLDRIFTIDDATLDQLLRPCLVTFVPISAHDLKWLRDDVERMKGLSPGQFQGLIADRLDRMGLQVRMVGDVFRRDGGIDIIASQSASGAFPFLLAVQVKHHRAARKTTAPEVREFHGALSSCASPFQMGLIVTNTTFTADAAWFAAHNQRLLRLRDCQDLRRWLQDEFVDDSEWREVPAEIEVAPGIRVLIPRPHPVLSRTH